LSSFSGCKKHFCSNVEIAAHCDQLLGRAFEVFFLTYVRRACLHKLLKTFETRNRTHLYKNTVSTSLEELVKPRRHLLKTLTNDNLWCHSMSALTG